VSVNAVVSADASGRITQFNPAAERTFGSASEEVLRKPFPKLLAEHCHEPYRLELDRLFSSEDVTNAGRTIELVGKRKNGEEFPLELCLVTWRSGKSSLYTCVVRDISERKQVASDLQELLHRVEAIARTDELTGMANRRAWDEELRGSCRAPLAPGIASAWFCSTSTTSSASTTSTATRRATRCSATPPSHGE